MKRLFAFLTALVCAFLLPLFACAEGGMEIGLSDGSGRVGETVDLTLSAAENPGIIGLQLKVKFDEKKLKLLKVTDGGILGEEIHHQEELTSPYVLSWENYVAEENFTENGTLCTLTFRILSGEEGEEIPVSLSAGEYGVMNYNLVDVARTLTDGGVTVTGNALPPVWLYFLGGAPVLILVAAALIFWRRSVAS